MTSCVLSSCRVYLLQVTPEIDDRNQKTATRRLWSDELDLSPDERAKELDAYLTTDPWADEVKPANYWVRAS